VTNDDSLMLLGGFSNGNLTPGSAAPVPSPPAATPIVFTIGGTATNFYVDYTNDVTLQSEIHTNSIQVQTEKIVTLEKQVNVVAEDGFAPGEYVDEDDVPRFVTGWLPSGAAFDKTIASGNWNNPAIWSLGTVPTTGDLVKISVGDTVTYNVDDDSHALLA